jgi:hypothetical protein
MRRALVLIAVLAAVIASAVIWRSIVVFSITDYRQQIIEQKKALVEKEITDADALFTPIHKLFQLSCQVDSWNNHSIWIAITASADQRRFYNDLRTLCHDAEDQKKKMNSLFFVGTLSPEDLEKNSREFRFWNANFIAWHDATLSNSTTLLRMDLYYVLPMLAGFFGSLLAVGLLILEKLKQVAEGKPAEPDIAFQALARIFLGTFCGLIIGLIYDDVLKTQVTYSPLVIGFIVGFMVEPFLEFLKRLTKVFQT